MKIDKFIQLADIVSGLIKQLTVCMPAVPLILCIINIRHIIIDFAQEINKDLSHI
jgi:hypothetical protein